MIILLLIMAVTAQWSRNTINQANLITRTINYEREDINGDIGPIKYDYLLNSYLNEYSKIGQINENVLDAPELRYFSSYIYFFKHPVNRPFKQIINKGSECYAIDSCSKKEFTNFVSCIKNTTDCKNAHLFYPRIFKPSFRKIAHINYNKIRYYFGQQAFPFNYSVDWPFFSY